MELYNVPRDTWIKVLDEETKVPPAALTINTDDVLLFHKVDGMYSRCSDLEGNTKHLAVWTEVQILSDSELDYLKINEKNT